MFQNMFGRDASVTHLPTAGLIAQPSEQVLKKIPTSPKPTITKQESISKFGLGPSGITSDPKSPRSPKQEDQTMHKSNSKSVVDLYNKDLGTMGVPREIASMRPDQNFLFVGGYDAAPGQYNPEKPQHSPSALFGSDATKPRVDPKQSVK